jgi:hypothetical protein
MEMPLVYLNINTVSLGEKKLLLVLTLTEPKAILLKWYLENYVRKVDQCNFLRWIKSYIITGTPHKTQKEKRYGSG